MVSYVQDDDRLLSDESDAPEDAIDKSQTNKKKSIKVPRRVLKAKRERLKREQLNDLFTKLASVLELNDQNNGKACILNETIRLLKDMVCQIQSLRKENVTLLSESNYILAEKNELKDENSAIELQIKEIQSELEEKLGQSKPDLNLSPPESWQTNMASNFMQHQLPQLPITDTSSQQPPILGPLYVIPLNPDLQVLQKVQPPTNTPVSVSKPHARYPTPADSWPLHLLSNQPETTAENTTS